MIIVTANVGLLPFKIGKMRAYITDKKVGFLTLLGSMKSLLFFIIRDNRRCEFAG